MIPTARKSEDRLIRVTANSVPLDGNLNIPEAATGIVVFAHGSGSSRHSPRNRYVAQTLRERGLATLLIDLLLQQSLGAHVTRFEFRAMSPLFGNAPFAVCGRPDESGGNVALWAKGADGRLAMNAVATVA